MSINDLNGLLTDHLSSWYKQRKVPNHMVKECKGLGRWLTVSLIIGLLAALVLPLLSPLAVEASAPNRPSNVSPANGTIDISLTHTFRASAFSDPDTHYASQWQITRTSGNYSSPVFDSGVVTDPAKLTQITISSGYLRVSTTYYWRVRYQDDKGWWSSWSIETSFTTIVSANPSTPINMSPVNGATNIALHPTLQSSAFVSPDGGATHAASRWQITTTSGNYTSPVYDSGVDTDTAHRTQITLLSVILKVNTNYYWRIRHQDSYGNWSDWSIETSFTTIADTTPPAISEVTVSSVTDTTAVITWTTDETSTSQVEYGTTTAYGSTTTLDATLVNSHRVTISSLSANTIYHYRVRSKDAANNEAISADGIFTTTAMQAPVTPSNTSPANGATSVSLTPTLTSSPFSDHDVGDRHTMSIWQIATDDLFSNIVFDCGVYDSESDPSNLTRITVPSGKLSYDTTYYWHVRYWDSYGNQSHWSTATSFTTAQAPATPGNISPANGVTGISVTPMLTSSAFSDPDVGDSHKASQWQITTILGNYDTPAKIYDSGTDTINKTSIIIPSGTLSYNTTYYWQVRHQDSYGYWSNWSAETSFITVVPGIPSRPSDVSPTNSATGVILTPTFRASVFDDDADPGDTHAASQWQIRKATDPPDYSVTVYDSGIDTANLSQITIPSDILDYDIIYYWHVKYQDSSGDWSAYSTETSFTTVTLSKWTFMVYLDADNNLGGNGISDFNQMELVGSTNDVNIVVLMDRLNGDWTTARLFRVTQDSDVSIINSTAIADWGEVNMGNPRTLEDFATWTIENQPAQHYVLVLWNHGDVRGVCWDDTNGGDYLTDAEIQQSLQAIRAETGVTLDIVGFDACLMGMAEIDYQIKEYANIAVGSQELTYGWPYYYILRDLTADPDMTSTELARQIVQEYGEYYHSFAPLVPATSYTQSAVHLSGSATLANCISDFAQSLMDSEEWQNIVAARADAQEFYHPDYGYGYVDLYHFASMVLSRVSDTTVQTKAQNVMDAIDGLVLAETHDMMVHPNAHGISIFFPESLPANWADYRGGLDFSADTQWDEFLLTYWAAVSLPPLPPNTPGNVSPASGASDIILIPTLRARDFSDPDLGDTHFASRWQIRTDSETYDSPMFDSGVDTSNLTQLAIPSGYLEYDTTYYWRVRYQDSYGNWSGWSTETSFTTAIPRPPNQPTPNSPSHGASGISLTPTLRSSGFSARDEGDSHKASQWQIRTESGTYDSPVFDSGLDTANLNKITIPAGKLDYGITYYWRVRHQDRYDNWSAYSSENLFTTVIPPPNQPTVSSPSDGATAISLTPTLQSSAFVSPDTKATHAASQWQIATTSGDYSSPVYDSGADTTNLTSITVPSEILGYDTTYYWHVRYQDSYDNWSDYSPEASFATVRSIKADLSAAPIQAAPGQIVTFTDTSTGDATSWVWDFGDGTTPEEWTTRPEDGKVTHLYSSVGNYTVSLKVAGPAGEDTKTKVVLIQAPAPAPSHGKGLPLIPIVVGIVVVLAGGGLLWYMRRR